MFCQPTAEIVCDPDIELPVSLVSMYTKYVLDMSQIRASRTTLSQLLGLGPLPSLREVSG